MAKNKDNMLTQGLSGSMGPLLTFRQRAGQTIVAKKRRETPASNSAKAVAIRERFRTALTYAMIAIKDPELKEYYKSKAAPGQSAFNLAVKDGFTPPKIVSVNAAKYHGAVADSISVQVLSSFKVVSVKVSIKGSDGVLIEEGDAVQQPTTVDWLYTATKANSEPTGSKVGAVATGLPGNFSSLELSV